MPLHDDDDVVVVDDTPLAISDMWMMNKVGHNTVHFGTPLIKGGSEESLPSFHHHCLLQILATICKFRLQRNISIPRKYTGF